MAFEFLPLVFISFNDCIFASIPFFFNFIQNSNGRKIIFFYTFFDVRFVRVQYGSFFSSMIYRWVYTSQVFPDGNSTCTQTFSNIGYAHAVMVRTIFILDNIVCEYILIMKNNKGGSGGEFNEKSYN